MCFQLSPMQLIKLINSQWEIFRFKRIFPHSLKMHKNAKSVCAKLPCTIFSHILTALWKSKCEM